MKALHFIYGLALGGAESFIRSCMLALKDDGVDWHFAIQNPVVTNRFFTENLSNENIHILPLFTRNPIGQYRVLTKLIKAEQFDVVHIHANALINPIPLLACLNCDQSFVIHSHSTSTNPGLVCRIVHSINKAWLGLSKSAIRIACSQSAGRWMFGRKIFSVVNNAIDINHYIFNEQSRAEIRSRYGIPDDTYVIGTVGRMVEAKNYPFMISLFRDFLKLNPSAKLLLVGDGPLRADIEKLASDLDNKVIFAGAQQETASFYSAMDCFIAPSLFEGLSIVTVEAQTSGVNIVVSDAIPEEVNVSGLINRLSLADPTETWLDLLARPQASNHERKERGLKLLNCKFNLPYLAETLRGIYSE